MKHFVVIDRLGPGSKRHYFDAETKDAALLAFADHVHPDLVDNQENPEKPQTLAEILADLVNSGYVEVKRIRPKPAS